MNLKKLKCPTCGANIDNQIVDLTQKVAKCPACDETFIIEQAENFAKVEVDKTKDITIYRKNLLTAVEKDDGDSIRRYAEKILDILPEDYEAGYFYAYAIAKSGDSRYLYDFYNDFDREYTEESCMRVAEHIVNHGELRDDRLIAIYLGKLKYYSENYSSIYKQILSDKIAKEDLYDDITRDVFICHRSIDGKIAERIVKELEDDGNKCWISSRNLRPNDNENYWDNIKRAIKSCRIFLVVSSRDAMLSTDVKKEIAFAKDLNKKRLEVKIDDSEHNSLFKDFFDGCKWIKGENYNEIKTRISDLIVKVLSNSDSDKPLSKPIVLTENDEIINSVKASTNKSELKKEIAITKDSPTAPKGLFGGIANYFKTKKAEKERIKEEKRLQKEAEELESQRKAEEERKEEQRQIEAFFNDNDLTVSTDLDFSSIHIEANQNVVLKSGPKLVINGDFSIEDDTLFVSSEYDGVTLTLPSGVFESIEIESQYGEVKCESVRTGRLEIVANEKISVSKSLVGNMYLESQYDSVICKNIKAGVIEGQANENISIDVFDFDEIELNSEYGEISINYFGEEKVCANCNSEYGEVKIHGNFYGNPECGKVISATANENIVLKNSGIKND